jgi:hypothetical protein
MYIYCVCILILGDMMKYKEALKKVNEVFGGTELGNRLYDEIIHIMEYNQYDDDEEVE